MNCTNKFLVAHPKQSGFFRNSVILVVDHDQGGASGFIINKPHTMDIQEVSRDIGYHTDVQDLCYIGGPVHCTAAYLLHSANWYSETTKHVLDIAVTSDEFMFEKISMGDEPEHSKMLFGVCGWAPGQLDAELEGINKPYPSWVVCDSDLDTVFSKDTDTVWQDCLERAGNQLFQNYL